MVQFLLDSGRPKSDWNLSLSVTSQRSWEAVRKMQFCWRWSFCRNPFNIHNFLVGEKFWLFPSAQIHLDISTHRFIIVNYKTLEISIFRHSLWILKVKVEFILWQGIYAVFSCLKVTQCLWRSMWYSSNEGVLNPCLLVVLLPPTSHLLSDSVDYPMICFLMLSVFKKLGSLVQNYSKFHL